MNWQTLERFVQTCICAVQGYAGDWIGGMLLFVAFAALTIFTVLVSHVIGECIK